MANVDVSDLLSDPDFTDPFSVTRTQTNIDAQGRLQPELPLTVPAFGAVQPASGRTLNLFPELANVGAVIEIWTTFGLQVASNKNNADQITWKGNTYIVSHIDDWGNYSGFVHAICTMQDLVPQDTPL